MKFMKRFILLTLGIGILGYGLGIGFIFLTTKATTFSPSMLTNTTAIAFLAVGMCLGLVLSFMNGKDDSSLKAKSTGKTAKGDG